MSEYEAGERYEIAIRRFQEHLTKGADGRLHLDPRADAQSLNIDPVVFADLKRSLDHTNKMIERGEIGVSDIEFI